MFGPIHQNLYILLFFLAMLGPMIMQKTLYTPLFLHVWSSSCSPRKIVVSPNEGQMTCQELFLFFLFSFFLSGCLAVWLSGYLAS